jgi:hypothetical protein
MQDAIPCQDLQVIPPVWGITVSIMGLCGVFKRGLTTAGTAALSDMGTLAGVRPVRLSSA